MNKKLKIVAFLLSGILSTGYIAEGTFLCDPPPEAPAPAKPVKPTPPKK